jgi:hypothetical protein
MLKKCPNCQTATEHELIEGKKNKKLVCSVCGKKTFVKKRITQEELNLLKIPDKQKSYFLTFLVPGL